MHTTNPQLYEAALEIEGEAEASFVNMDGEKMPITDFKVENGRIPPAGCGPESSAGAGCRKRSSVCAHPNRPNSGQGFLPPPAS